MEITDEVLYMNNKYRPKKLTNIAFIILICIGLLLVMIRWGNAFNSDFVVVNEEIHSHISNFVLSMLLYLNVGFIWLMCGVKFRIITILGLLLIVANFLCETVMGFMNTIDIMDAIYGTVGVAISFVFLFVAKKYGMISNEDWTLIK